MSSNKIDFVTFFNDDDWRLKLEQFLDVELDAAIVDFEYAKHYFFNDKNRVDIQVEYENGEIFVINKDEYSTRVQVENNADKIFENIKNVINSFKH